jgi:Zn-dependent protease with chaperone function
VTTSQNFISGDYLDGKSAKASLAHCSLHNGQWQVRLEEDESVEHHFAVAKVHIDEANKNLPRRLRFPNGAIWDAHDGLAFDTMLHAAGIERSLVDRAQNSWRLAGAALALSVVAMVAGYFWGLPWVASTVAQSMPLAVERALGDQAWSMMDKQLLSPSALPSARQEAIARAYTRLQGANAPATELLFRKVQGGANAFALPGGRVILTDAMVELADQLGASANEALLGVLAHEQGHVAHRHSLRQIVQATAVTGIVSLWLGDVSTLVAGLPVVVLEMKYSRDFETEADDYAIALLDRVGVDRRPTARLFEALLAQESGSDGGIFSSHPPTAQRAKRYNSRQQN